MRVVPRARVVLSEREAPAELPRVNEADVDGQPPPGPPAASEVQMEVELLHHEAAASIHEEGPQGCVSPQVAVCFLEQVKHGGEEHLVQKSVHAEEREAQDAR